MINIDDIEESSGITVDSSHYGYNLFNTIMERYEGKDKRFLKCEKCLQDIIDTIKEKGPASIVSKTNKANQELCKTLESIFKIKKMSLIWKFGGINAYTFVASSFTKEKVNKNYKSGKDNNSLKIFTAVYTEIVTICNLNARELLATILHEIGHNFYLCTLGLLFDTLQCIMNPLSYLILIPLKHGMIKLDELQNYLYGKFPEISEKVGYIYRIKSEVMLFLGKFNTLSVFYKIVFNGARLVTHPSRLFKYGDEKGADSFATKYGYGPDLISALKKFEMAENSVYGKLVQTSPFIEVTADIISLQDEIFSCMAFDPHPSNYQRAQSTLKKLKKDYDNGDFPPEMKKDLERQITEMEETIKTVAVINESSDAPHIKQTIYDMMSKVTGGHTDYREILNFYFDKKSF